MERWIERAKEIGFSEAGILDPSTLKVMQVVRDTCASDKCKAYGHNWTCPPACGTLEECSQRMQRYKQGLLLQTTGHLQKTIDTRGYTETEKKHRNNLQQFHKEIRAAYSDVLCLGAGGCLICEKCAYPEPCRFPELAVSSMEAYGLFVTQVCRDNHLKYYYGPKTITYTTCVLF